MSSEIKPALRVHYSPLMSPLARITKAELASEDRALLRSDNRSPAGLEAKTQERGELRALFDGDDAKQLEERIKKKISLLDVL